MLTKRQETCPEDIKNVYIDLYKNAKQLNFEVRLHHNKFMDATALSNGFKPQQRQLQQPASLKPQIIADMNFSDSVHLPQLFRMRASRLNRKL